MAIALGGAAQALAQVTVPPTTEVAPTTAPPPPTTEAPPTAPPTTPVRTTLRRLPTTRPPTTPPPPPTTTVVPTLPPVSTTIVAALNLDDPSRPGEGKMPAWPKVVSLVGLGIALSMLVARWLATRVRHGGPDAG